MSAKSSTVGLWLFLAALAHAAPAFAAPPRSFALNLVREVGAESCISSRRLATSIERLLGPVFVSPGDAELAIEALLERAPDGRWRARVVVSDGEGGLLGERELRSSGDACRDLDRQLVLVIALAVDPEFALRGLPEELLQTFPAGDDVAADLLRELAPAREPGSGARTEALAAQLGGERPGPEAPADRRAALVEERRDEAEPRGWKWELGAALASGVGMLPRVAAGPALSIGLTPASFWPVVLSGGMWFENDAPLATPTARGEAIHFTMLQLGLALCPSVLETTALRLRLCAGMQFARRATDSAALEDGLDATRTAFGPVLAPELSFAISRLLWLNGNISVHTPLSRDAYTYIDQFGTKHTLFRPDFASFSGQLGVLFRL